MVEVKHTEAEALRKAQDFDRIVAARKQHVDSVSTYNARLRLAKAERENGDWSTKLDNEYRAMSDAQSNFIRTAQDLADAALCASPPTREEGGRDDV